MANIRTTCPTCGPVDLPTEEISLDVDDDGARGRYAFTCPNCRADITRAGDRTVVGLLLAAGVTPYQAEAPVQTAPTLPAEDRNPCPDAPALTLDDLIDLHFLLA